jgi:hypothetical protein
MPIVRINPLPAGKVPEAEVVSNPANTFTSQRGNAGGLRELRARLEVVHLSHHWAPTALPQYGAKDQ